MSCDSFLDELFLLVLKLKRSSDENGDKFFVNYRLAEKMKCRREAAKKKVQK